MPNNLFKIAFKYIGLYIVVSMLLSTLSSYLMPTSGNTVMTTIPLFYILITFLNFLIFALVLGYGLRELLRSNNYQLPVSSVFVFGFLMSAVPSLTSIVSIFVQSFFNEDLFQHLTINQLILSMSVSFFVSCLYTLLIIFFIGRWLVFKKAGEKGWHSIVPILGILTMIKIAKKDQSLLFLLFIPLINIFAYYQLVSDISFSFNKSNGFTAGLFFLPFIFFPILGFGDAKYKYGNHEPVTQELNIEDHLVQ